MDRKPLLAAQVLCLLAETPRRISELTGGLALAQLHARPGPEEWSANDVLAHLRSCADVWGGCIEEIVAHDHPTLRAVNPRTWVKQTDYPELEFHASLRAYAEQRATLLAVLGRLPADGWQRAATVTGAGAPLERTVHTYAQRLARHERPHVRQVEQVVTRVRQH